MVTSLLHDIGKLVLVHAYPGYPRQVHGEARTPEERIQRERRELGVDHALVGGVLARRWGLPRTIAAVIERHHAEDCDGESAIIRLADMLAHYVLGGPITPVGDAARRAHGRRRARRAAAVHVRPAAADRRGERPRQVDPCPMSAREVEVLRRLAKGMVYKQIAGELGALDEHGAHAPAQRVRQARRDGPRSGRPDRHRARLDLTRRRGKTTRSAREGAASGLRSSAMLSITTKSPYAVSALVELHRCGDEDRSRSPSSRAGAGIPVQFLEQLFATLRRAGVLRSQRGVKGGYSFARPAAEVTVLEVVELLDGPLGRGSEGVFADAAAPPGQCSATPRSPAWPTPRPAPPARRCTRSRPAPVAKGRSARLQGF